MSAGGRRRREVVGKMKYWIYTDRNSEVPSRIYLRRAAFAGLHTIFFLDHLSQTR
jgi:hypothetical protein